MPDPSGAMVFPRIAVDPGRCGGMPRRRELRVADPTVVAMVAEGQTPEAIVAELAELELDDIRVAPRYAAEGPRARGAIALARLVTFLVGSVMSTRLLAFRRLAATRALVAAVRRRPIGSI